MKVKMKSERIEDVSKGLSLENPKLENPKERLKTVNEITVCEYIQHLFK